MDKKETNKKAESNCSVLLECPVCVQIFEDPKVLDCGHSLCSNCCDQIRSFDVIVCPVCRATTQVRCDGLQTNFCLRDLVQHHVIINKKRKYSCTSCNRPCSDDECWLCSDCSSSLLCSKCAIKAHNGHFLQEVNDLVQKRNEELMRWNKTAEPAVREAILKLKQIQVNCIRIEQHGK
ncbi:unnamed protein product [Soboliphyme baturini]|uniref:RING-type domain-containing protein n=1 Tax=Soboliphyme baturini TaxID=241478 RepID=A0A183J5A9_9BILA|nr:unnamed protein product [Soboliphyme baturini]